MNVEPCHRCGADAPLKGGTITDSSGGSWVELCPHCWVTISTPRCRVCGGHDEPGGRADSIHVDGEERSYNICDECRKSIVFRETTPA